MRDLLSKHPKVKYMGSPSWPPQPGGGAYDASTVQPQIGRGTLKGATIFRTHGYGGLPDHLELQVECYGRMYATQLWVDDPGILETLREFLSQHINQPLDDLGRLMIDL
jgi:hypothetical protein